MIHSDYKFYIVKIYNLTEAKFYLTISFYFSNSFFILCLINFKLTNPTHNIKAKENNNTPKRKLYRVNSMSLFLDNMSYRVRPLYLSVSYH